MGSIHSSWAHYGRILIIVGLFHIEEELIALSQSFEEVGKDISREIDEDLETRYSLNFLKKRVKGELEESDELKKIEGLPGGSLKPLKKTQ